MGALEEDRDWSKEGTIDKMEENANIRDNINAISDKLNSMSDGIQKNKMALKYIKDDDSNNNRQVSIGDDRGLGDNVVKKDSMESPATPGNETSDYLYDIFDKQNRNDEWATTFEDSIWQEYNKMEDGLGGAEEYSKFGIIGLECKDTLCKMTVEYGHTKNPVQNMQQVDKMLQRIHPECGFTTIRYDNINDIHLWYLECR